MAPARDDLRDQLARALAGRDDVLVALLFGSQARGCADATSDVDLAVRAPRVDLLTLAADLGAALEQEIDVVSLDGCDVPLLSEIVEHGILVHEGRRGEGARWRSSALATLETDRPWYGRMRDAWLRRVASRGVRAW